MRCILEVLRLQGLHISRCIFTIYVSKNEAVCPEVRQISEVFFMGTFLRFLHPNWSCFLRSSVAICKYSPYEVYKESSVHFHNFCIQKQSCSLWSSNAFLKFSACKVYRKSSGRIFAICVSKNEAVSCEVQTHFGSSLSASFAEKVLGELSTFLRPKTRSCLPWSSDRFLKFCLCMLHKKVLGAISRFMRPKTKLFAVKFRHISEVFTLQGLQKSSGRIITIFASKNEVYFIHMGD